MKETTRRGTRRADEDLLREPKPDGETTKVIIRDVPVEVVNALGILAEQEDRPKEAMLRRALRQMAQPVLTGFARSTRRQDLSLRLMTLLDFSGEKMTPSMLAEMVGETHAEPMEQAFRGEVEPGFELLRRIADIMGVEREWLLHGVGPMMPVSEDMYPADAKTAALYLMDLSDVQILDDGAIRSLHFVRTAAPEGTLCIVRGNEVGKYGIILSGTMLRTDSSTANLKALKLLVETLKLLRGYDISVQSHLMMPNDFAALREGRVYPRSLLERSRTNWWEDLIAPDTVQAENVPEYCPGFRQLRQMLLAE